MTTLDPVPGPRAEVRSPTSGALTLGRVLSYGPVIRALAARDMKARYKQSLLGPAWTVFQPLALLICFVVGFHSVAHVRTGGVPYLLFALSGLSLWSYFQSVQMSASGSLINNYTLVRWTACPRLALPLATLVSNLPALLITGLAAGAASAASGRVWVGWCALPLLLVWLLALSCGAAVMLAVLAVRARDVISALPFLLQVAMFLSPVAYSTSGLSAPVRTIVALNPLTGLLDTWRWALLHQPLQAAPLCIGLGVTAALALISWRLFVAMDGRIADEI